MHRVIVGTAGHVDHGKTRLIEALTGIDCDRWKEEKDRGITIDLGFAHLEREDVVLGFVDVPGHERFVHNALAGLGGIRIVLLVVAADEGVKPQTREHLEICTLLGLDAAVVALTKRDLVDDDLLELAELEVGELLADTPFAAARIVPVSSTTGDGVHEIAAALTDLAREHAPPADDDRPARLPIDRAFNLRGRGAVVTGTLLAGEVATGDTLELLPVGVATRVRSIQVHGEDRSRAFAGERTSLQIAGVGLEELARGEQLAVPGTLAPSTRLLARLRLLPHAVAIDGWSEVKLHHAASEVMARVRPLAPRRWVPGEEALVELRLATPVAAVRGDRLVLRRPSPPATLGGGVLLDPAWRPRRGPRLERALSALDDEEVAIRLWIHDAGPGGLSDEELARRIGVRPDGITARMAAWGREGRVLRLPSAGGFVSLDPTHVQRAAARARRILGRYFADQRLALGMPKAEAVRRILSPSARAHRDAYLGWLEAADALVVDGDRVNLPGRTARLDDAESRLSKALVEAFERAGFTPPSPQTLCREVGGSWPICEGVLEFLVARGRLVRLPGGLLIAASSLERLADELRASGWERFSVTDFKDRFELSRKWAIPLLEHLDAVGITRRAGEHRVLTREL